jgi:hypothetical protein
MKIYNRIGAACLIFTIALILLLASGAVASVPFPVVTGSCGGVPTYYKPAQDPDGDGCRGIAFSWFSKPTLQNPDGLWGLVAIRIWSRVRKVGIA